MFGKLLESYENILNEGDIRSKPYPLVQSPKYALYAVTLYQIMLVVAPRIMKNREAFQLRGLLIVYNALSVICSFYMTVEIFRWSVINPDYHKSLIIDDTSPTSMALINVHWLYYISKYVELLDTFFFILRKKNNQVSFLHVYHHGSMIMLQWALVKHVPGGGSFMGPMLNSFVHTVMYAYYMLSAFGPHMQKYLWWKKYITKLQMTQFVMLIGHCFYCLYQASQETGSTLGYHSLAKNMYILHVAYLFTLLFLFNQFYQKAYRARARVEEKEKMS